MRKLLFILLIPVYVLTTGCPPEEPPLSCMAADDYRMKVQEKFARLYTVYVRDTIAYSTDTIFRLPFPDSLGEVRRQQFLHVTDSCQKILDQLCTNEQMFDNTESRRITSTKFPFRLFIKRKKNPYEQEVGYFLPRIERVTDSLFTVLSDTTNI